MAQHDVTIEDVSNRAAALDIQERDLQIDQNCLLLENNQCRKCGIQCDNSVCVSCQRQLNILNPRKVVFSLTGLLSCGMSFIFLDILTSVTIGIIVSVGTTTIYDTLGY